MKKIVAGLIVCASSVFIWSGPADAAPAACKTKTACRLLAYNSCVTSLKAQGFSTAAAQSRCATALS